MLRTVFHALVYDPIYNGLIFFVDTLPAHDVGVAVVLVTLIVRVILFPLSRSAIRTQIKMKEVAPEIEALKKRHKDAPEELSRAIFALYRERGVNPFSGFLLLLIQLPILLGLYWVFAQGGLPSVNTELIYPFVAVPETVNMKFLGLIDMGERSIVLAVLAGLTQFVYTRLSMGPRSKAPAPITPSLSADVAKSFDVQLRYVLPVVVGSIAYFIAAAAPLFWVTGNLFMIGQELLAGRRFSGVHKTAP